MPKPPPPLVVEVVENQDEAAADEAQIAVLQLLIDFILEDRALARETEKLDSRASA